MGIDLGPSGDFAIPKPSSLGIYIPHGKDQAIMNYIITKNYEKHKDCPKVKATFV